MNKIIIKRIILNTARMLVACLAISLGNQAWAQYPELLSVGQISNFDESGSLIVNGQIYALSPGADVIDQQDSLVDIAIGDYVAISGTLTAPGQANATEVLVIDGVYVPGSSPEYLMAIVDSVSANSAEATSGQSSISLTNALHNQSIALTQAGDVIEVFGSSIDGQFWAVDGNVLALGTNQAINAEDQASSALNGLRGSGGRGLRGSGSRGLRGSGSRGLRGSGSRGLRGSGGRGLRGSGSRGLRGSGSRGLRGSGSRGLRGSISRGLRGSGTRGLRGSGTRGLRGSGTRGLRGSGTRGLRGSGTRGLRGSGTRGLRGSGTRGLRGSGTRGLRGSGTRGLRGSGTRGLRGSGTRGLRGSGTRGLRGSGTRGLRGSGTRGLRGSGTRGLRGSGAR